MKRDNSNNKEKISFKSIVILAGLIAIPLIVNFLYMLGKDISKPNTVFEAADLLSYVGVCIFGWLVYNQTEKLHKQNLKLQEQNLELQEQDLKYNTFVFSNIDKIQVSKTIKTYEIDPIPSVVIMRRNGFESVKNERIKYTASSESHESESTLCINPYVGIANNDSINPRIVLWRTTDLFRNAQTPYPERITHYTPINLCLFAKPSRDFYINEIAIYEFNIALYNQDDEKFWFESEFIKEPLIIFPKSTKSEEKDDCQPFDLIIYLLHTDETFFSNFKYIDLELDIYYTNLLGVATHCHQLLSFKSEGMIDNFMFLNSNQILVDDIKVVKKKTEVTTP